MLARRARSLVLLLGLASWLTGCALPWASQGPQALPQAQQVFHLLNLGPANGDLEALDPALVQFSSDYDVAQLIFPPLITLNDENQAIPWAADRWEVSADGLIWTFHLRHGMHWSDGVPIDASTYAYSVNRSLDPCTASGTSFFLAGTDTELIKSSMAFRNGPCQQSAPAPIATLIGRSLVVGDPLTLLIVLSHPAAYFPMVLTLPTAWAQPRQLIEQYGPVLWPSGTRNYNGWTEHLAGFGGNLFTLTRWDHTVAGNYPTKRYLSPNLVLRRNEGFWGPKPQLREIDWTLYRDSKGLWSDAQTGFGDSFPVQSWFAPAGASDELAKARVMPGFHQEPDLAIYYLALNWAVPPFDDPRARQAFTLALDRTAIAQILPQGGMPTIHMVPQGMPGYNSALADPAGRTGDAALKPDVAQARTVWASYVAEKCAGDAAKCPAINLFYLAGSHSLDVLTSTLSAQWQAALPGLHVTATPVYTGFCHVLGSCRLQMIPQTWIADYPDPQDFLSLLVHTGAQENQTHISVLDGDTLLDQADTAADQVQRLRLYQQAEQLYVTQVAWLPLAQLLNTYVVRPHVAGGYRQRLSGIAALTTWQRIYVTST